MRCNMLFLKNHAFNGAIFDIDGTLIDSLSKYLVCFNIELERISVQPVSREVLFGYLDMGLSLKAILTKVLPGDKHDDAIVDKLAGDILCRFMKVDMEIQLLPGVMEVLSFLKSRDIKIGLATGRTSSRAYERKRLQAQGLDSFVDTIVTCTEITKRKPAPDVLLACAAELGVPINKCLAIGDSVSDVLAAKNAGAISVGVATGLNKISNLKKQHPEIILQTLDELMDLLAAPTVP